MKKFQYNSPVILSFFLISFVSLILGWLSNGRTTALLFSVYRSSLMNPLTFVRFFGHVLGHADFEHFLGNMLMLLVVGPPLEERYGSKVLLTGILLTYAHHALVAVRHGKWENSRYPNPGSGPLSGAGVLFHPFYKGQCGQSHAHYRRGLRNSIRFLDQQKAHRNKALLQVRLQQMQNHHINRMLQRSILEHCRPTTHEISPLPEYPAAKYHIVAPLPTLWH